MRNVLRGFLLAAVITSLLCPGQSRAQVRGDALFKLLTSGQLVKTEGERRVRWLPDGKGYFLSEKDPATDAARFFRVDPRSGKKSPLFNAKTQKALRQRYNELTSVAAKGLPFSRFEFAKQGSAISFEVGGRYFLFDLRRHHLRELKRPEVKHQPGSKDLMRNMRVSQLWNGTYSPDYRYFAYVKEYDLYLVDTATGAEKRLTSGGNKNLYNGRPDWVYPEEFSQMTAYWWSPDSRKIAYYQFDEKEVYKYPLVHDLKAEAELELQSYPTAGEPNPTVKLFIVDIESGEIVGVQTNSSSDVYIVRPTWLRDSSELTFQRLNRRQNHLELLAANPATGTVRTVLEEQEEAFINLHDDFILLADGKRFLWSSERTGWRHIYLYDLQGRLVKQLTSGDWPVDRVLGVDQKGKWVYFTANTEMGLETHFYRVRLDGTKLTKLTRHPGTHRISLDPAAKYYTDSYSAFDTPPVMALHRADGKKLRTLMTTNTGRLDSLQLEPPELVIVKAADGVTDLHGLLFKPAGFDASKQYPLLVTVYGGPHSKSVRNSYQMSSYRQAYAQLGFIVWTMDNRGLRNRGKKFETATYLKLGQVDIADQTAGVRQITRRPYIDAKRVGIFGGSYGGYMTCLALLKEPDVFHVGVAHAPVTHWRNYDTIYTERYMRTPQENPEGYKLGSALEYAANLKGKLLLIHGSVDNNVHPGNTIQLIQELVKAQKQFDLMFYPEQRHGIRGPGRRHSSTLRLEFFKKHLLKPGLAPTM